MFLVATLLLQFEAQGQKSKSKEPLPLDPLIRTGVLSNGLTYFIRHNEKPDNRVALRMAVKTGSTMEDDDQQGLAHLIEHMAFNGTKHFAKQDLINYLEKTGTKFGPHLNAYTSFDETVYMLQVPTDDAEILSNGLLILEDSNL
jgi:zinc protease